MSNDRKPLAILGGVKIAIAFNTKADTPDRRASTLKVLPALQAQSHNYDLWWFDGSLTPEGQTLAYRNTSPGSYLTLNITGGPDYGFLYAITQILKSPNNYDYIGFCEDDVLLEPDWFERTMELFEIGRHEGIPVGAVSARAYEDRCMIQRHGYAVMHNLGWGHVIFTRKAAKLTVDNYRTGWTTENRRTFSALSGRDIGPFWVWKGLEQWFCSDWGNDAALAANGLASLALTPSACDMIYQNPPLEKQNLRVVKREVSMLRDDRVFDNYKGKLELIRSGYCELKTRPKYFQLDSGGILYFAHQLKGVGAWLSGIWETEWCFGFGPFALRAGPAARLSCVCLGPVEFLIGGGKEGGKCMLRDLQSGYEISPRLEKYDSQQSQLFMRVVMPASVNHRRIEITDITPGVVVYGMQATVPQMTYKTWFFDADCLPQRREGDMDASHLKQSDDEIDRNDSDNHDNKDSHRRSEGFGQRDQGEKLLCGPYQDADNDGGKQ